MERSQRCGPNDSGSGHEASSQKEGQQCHSELTPQALKVILSMPRTSEFIFPYNPKSVGTAFRRHRERVGIDDLQFHDLRHEGISRLFEKGKRDHFVMKTSGHQSRDCLDRYVNIEKKGDKFKNWHWLEWVVEYWKTIWWPAEWLTLARLASTGPACSAALSSEAPRKIFCVEQTAPTSSTADIRRRT